MNTIDHSVEGRLPASILPVEAETIASILMEEVNDLELGFTDWIDPDQLSGANLNKVGKIVGAVTTGKTDEELRVEILGAASRSKNRFTIPAILDMCKVFSKDGISPIVMEMWDGVAEFSILDGRNLLDGTDIFSPEIRSMSLLIDMTVGAQFNYAYVIDEIRKIKGTAINIYHRSRIETTGTDWNLSGSPDEVALILSGVEQTRFSISGPVYEIDIYQSLCPELDSLILYESGSPVANFSTGRIKLSIRNELKIILEV